MPSDTYLHRTRYRLWNLVSSFRRVCPANAHGRLIQRNHSGSICIDWMCRSDCERNGSCWCGKLRKERGEP